MRRLLITAVLLVATSAAFAQQERIASDFEIAQIERQLERSTDFLGQLSARLNLGDLRNARSEKSLARSEYQRALALSAVERRSAREASELSRYATATSYAALAHAKLGHAAESFELLEESVRVAGDDAKTWNVYSTSMSVLGRTPKAVSSARNAVQIAARELARDGSVDRRLDLAVYRHALAAALIGGGSRSEAETVLRSLSETLRGPDFEGLRREAARRESFEIFSTARGDVAAYIALHNRAHLRLASLYEERGARELATREYERVLEARSDDATALTALARLAPTAADRERRFVEAFDANPFAQTLIRDFRQHSRAQAPERSAATTVGAKMRRALALTERGDRRAAREQVDELLVRFPANETLVALRRELDRPAQRVSLIPGASPTREDLRRLLDALSAESLSSGDRSALDAMTFTSAASFDPPHDGSPGQTILAAGTIDGVAFRFAQPTAFAGTFDAATPLRLMYRVLGASRNGDADVLLLEPLKLEAGR